MPRKSLQGRTCGVSCDGGEGPAAKPHIVCSTVDAFAPLNTFQGDRALELPQRLDVPKPSWSPARCPHRLRDTP
ncbi:hypothetical protein XarbCFBP8152_20905 [Xanthomonas arboricola]|nr:hypothetical protein XarbCFBP8152_20905 [Xanthomonas arboricola]